MLLCPSSLASCVCEVPDDDGLVGATDTGRSPSSVTRLETNSVCPSCLASWEPSARAFDDDGFVEAARCERDRRARRGFAAGVSSLARFQMIMDLSSRPAGRLRASLASSADTGAVARFQMMCAPPPWRVAPVATRRQMADGCKDAAPDARAELYTRSQPLASLARGTSDRIFRAHRAWRAACRPRRSR